MPHGQPQRAAGEGAAVQAEHEGAKRHPAAGDPVHADAGEVEVDESYLALTERKAPLSAKGRQSNTTKVMVAIAVEIFPKGFGRIRIKRLDRGNQENLQRQEMGQMLRDWQSRFPGRIESMATALKNVVPSHFADPSVFDFASVKATGQADVDQGDMAFDPILYPERFLPPVNIDLNAANFVSAQSSPTCNS